MYLYSVILYTSPVGASIKIKEYKAVILKPNMGMYNFVYILVLCMHPVRHTRHISLYSKSRGLT